MAKNEINVSLNGKYLLIIYEYIKIVYSIIKASREPTDIQKIQKIKIVKSITNLKNLFIIIFECPNISIAGAINKDAVDGSFDQPLIL